MNRLPMLLLGAFEPRKRVVVGFPLALLKDLGTLETVMGN